MRVFELLWLTFSLLSSVLFFFQAHGKTSWLLGLWRGQERGDLVSLVKGGEMVRIVG